MIVKSLDYECKSYIFTCLFSFARDVLVNNMKDKGINTFTANNKIVNIYKL